jgi:hypothetical protein
MDEKEPFVVKKGDRFLDVDTLLSDDKPFGLIKTVKEITEDSEYCLIEHCPAYRFYLSDSQRDAWMELQPTEVLRGLRKLV